MSWSSGSFCWHKREGKGGGKYAEAEHLHDLRNVWHHVTMYHHGTLSSVLLQDEDQDGDVEVMVLCCQYKLQDRKSSIRQSLPHYSLRDLVECDGCLEKVDQTIPPVEERVGSKCHVDHGRALLARLTKEIVDSDGTEFEVNRHIKPLNNRKERPGRLKLK